MRNDPTGTAEADGQLRVGQQVVAGEEAIGELLGVMVHEGSRVLLVRRFGAGEDHLYIPASAVDRTVGNHIFLHLMPEDLLGQPWHEPPPGHEPSSTQ